MRGRPSSVGSAPQVPKGELDPGESPEDCVVRETREETGFDSRILAPLGEVVYSKSKKRVLAFLAEALSAPQEAVLPCGSWEVDRVEFLTLEDARARIHPDQAPLLDRAVEHLRERGGALWQPE